MGEFVNDNTICVVLENRAREICVCKVNMAVLSTVEIYTLSDCHSYVETTMLLDSLAPDEVLLRDGTGENALTKKVGRHLQSSASHVRVLFISRQYFDQDRGYELLKKVVAGTVDADLVAKYVVLAGCHALLRYVENVLQRTFPENSLRLMAGREGTGGCMLVDRRTAVNLELVSNARSGRQGESVFGCIDHTRTVVGARLLRSTLLSPLCCIDAIAMRLDMVEQLLGSRMGLADCAEVLLKFPDLDKMLSGLSTRARTLTAKTVRQGIDTLIYVKHSLLLGPALAAALDSVRRDAPSSFPATSSPLGDAPGGSLLGSMAASMSSPRYSEVLTEICQLLADDAAFSRNAHEMRHTECFAIRPGVNSFLDLARSTFLQCVEDIYALAQSYADTMAIDVKVSHSFSRGYFLLVAVGEAELPTVFIQAVQNRRSISCSTEQLMALSARASEAIQTALRLTNELIQDLLTTVRGHIDVLFVFVDGVALLDMLCSFAEMAASSGQTFCRPVLTESGPLVIQDGRHIILMSLEERSGSIFGPFVCNDTYFSSADSFQIVTGCNGAGKSTYLKQVALLTILAQVGCMVPARHATIPLRDRVLSRIGMADDMENNLSSFQTEMKECSYILDNVTSKSLVIIDELGRGTSNLDGMVIAMAVAEELIESEAYCLFATHFTNMTCLEDLYPGVRNIHMKGDYSAPVDGSSGNLQFMHKLGTGPCRVEEGYGIAAAERCGFPRSVLDDASQFAAQLKSMHAWACSSDGGSKSVAVLNSLLDNLLILKNSTLSPDGLRTYLHGLHSKMTAQQIAALANTVDALLVEADQGERDGGMVITLTSDNAVRQEPAVQEAVSPSPICRSGGAPRRPLSSEKVHTQSRKRPRSNGLTIPEGAQENISPQVNILGSPQCDVAPGLGSSDTPVLASKNRAAPTDIVGGDYDGISNSTPASPSRTQESTSVTANGGDPADIVLVLNSEDFL